MWRRPGDHPGQQSVRSGPDPPPVWRAPSSLLFLQRRRGGGSQAVELIIPAWHQLYKYDGVMLRWRPPTQRPLFSHHNNRLTDAILTTELVCMQDSVWCCRLDDTTPPPARQTVQNKQPAALQLCSTARSAACSAGFPSLYNCNAGLFCN